MKYRKKHISNDNNIHTLTTYLLYTCSEYLYPLLSLLLNFPLEKNLKCNITSWILVRPPFFLTLFLQGPRPPAPSRCMYLNGPLCTTQ